jgi:hypothetical protein
VDERPGFVPIVREPDVRRLTVASRAVLAEYERVRELVGHRPKMLAYLYGASAVRADDDLGRESGLVVQADELRWDELVELIRVAEEQLAIARHAGLDDWHPGCRDCQAVLAIARIRARYHYRTVGRAHDLAGGRAGRVSGPGFPAEGGTGSSGRGPP